MALETPKLQRAALMSCHLHLQGGACGNVQQMVVILLPCIVAALAHGALCLDIWCVPQRGRAVQMHLIVLAPGALLLEQCSIMSLAWPLSCAGSSARNWTGLSGLAHWQCPSSQHFITQTLQ